MEDVMVLIFLMPHQCKMIRLIKLKNQAETLIQWV